MTYLAHIATGIVLFFSSLWGSVFGFHTSVPLPAQNAVTATTTAQASDNQALISKWEWIPASRLPTEATTAGGSVSFWNDNGVVSTALGEPLEPTADFATFQAFCGVSTIYNSCSFAKDKDHVYVANGLKVLAGADPATIAAVFYPQHPVDIIYLKDASHVWRYETQGIATLVSGADPATFTVLRYAALGFLAKDKSHVYLDTSPIPDASPSTIAPISIPWGDDTLAPYLKDANHVWWMLGRAPLVMSTADPATFKFLGLIGDEQTDIFLSKDKDHVYSDTDILPGLDASSFIMLAQSSGFDDYEKDQHHVYAGLKIIPGADPTTFTVLGYGYGNDKNAVYYYLKVIPGADPATFVLFDFNFAKDKNRLYQQGVAVSEASLDVATFSLILGIPAGEESCFAKDKNYVYSYCNERRSMNVLPGADPTTFTYLDRSFQKDKNHVYYYLNNASAIHVIPDADPATFHVFEEVDSDSVFATGYEKDKNAVYHWEDKILGADPATFSVSDTFCVTSTYDNGTPASEEHYGQDKNHQYCAGKIVQ